MKCRVSRPFHALINVESGTRDDVTCARFKFKYAVSGRDWVSVLRGQCHWLSTIAFKPIQFPVCLSFNMISRAKQHGSPCHVPHHLFPYALLFCLLERKVIDTCIFPTLTSSNWALQFKQILNKNNAVFRSCPPSGRFHFICGQGEERRTKTRRRSKQQRPLH